MTYPAAPLGVRIRIAPGFNDYTSNPSTYTWVDITSDVFHMAEISDEIGANDDVSEENTIGSVVLKNESGRYTTDNPESDLFPFFDVGCPIEYAIDAGAGYVVQTITYLGSAVDDWTSGTQYRCLTTVTSGGQFRRLGLRPKIASPIYRSVKSRPRKAFWPMEDAAGAGAAASAIQGVGPLKPGPYNPPEFGQTDATIVPPGQMSMVKMVAGSNLSTLLQPPTSSTGIRFAGLFRVATTPGAAVGVLAVWEGYAGGSQKRYTLELHPSGLRFQAYNAAGAEISGAGIIGFGSHNTDTVWLELEISQTAATTITWTIRETVWKLLSDGSPSGLAASAGGTYTGTLGQLDLFSLSPNLELDDIYLGAWNIAELPWPTLGGLAAVVGWAGNKATERVNGMCGEFGVPVHVTATTLGQAMGPQLTDSLLANMRDVKKTDHGVLTDHLGVVDYRALSELYNLTPAITLSRVRRGELGKLQPVRDDTTKANIVSVSRRNGSSVTIQNDLDIARTGTYEAGGEELNVINDAALTPHAGWYLARGILTGKRYDVLTINMRVACETTPALAAQVLALKLGDRIAISSLPPQAAKGGIERQVRGRKMTVRNRGFGEWTVTYKLVPIEPYQAFQVDLSRLDTSGTELQAAATTTATSLLVATAGALIRTGGGQSVPLDVMGEQVTMTACSTEVQADTFTRSVSNGWGSIPATASFPAQAWSPAGGVAADFNVGGTTATMSIGAANDARTVYLISVNQVNPDMTGFASFAVAPTGAPLEIQINYRYLLSVNNSYTARILIEVGNTVRLRLFPPGSSNTIADVPTNLTHTAGVTYGLRVAPIGTRHRIKVWQGTAADEPSGWNIDFQDSSRVVAGAVNVRGGRALGNSNASPVILTWDNVSINNQQVLTVTRSVNTVVKTQAVGGRVKLWQGRGLGV